MTDLWPAEFATEMELRPPVTILKEQAALLGQKKQNIVEALVQRKGSYAIEGAERSFYYDFYIRSTPLNYAYKVFSISHGIEMYPVEFDIDEDILPGQPRCVANSEDELIKILAQILRSEKIKKVISAVYAQAKADPLKQPFQ